MAVILDSKDLAKIDKELAAESQVWDVLSQGAKDITAADFVGAKEVRVNKMKGFTAADYVRNGDNARAQLSVEKETVQLTQERWLGYDFDALDEQENAAYTVANAIQEHARLIATPEKDRYAINALLTNAQRTVGTGDAAKTGKIKVEAITSANALAAYDAAEAYMTDAEVQGPFVMFVSSDYYQALKNADGVSKSFTVNQVSMNGVNRTVAQLDGDVPIVKVGKSRLQTVDGKKVNFILVPQNVAMPIEKYNSVDLIPASQDRDGYRDTVKGLDYYDVIVLDNALPAIYVSWEETTTPTA